MEIILKGNKYDLNLSSPEFWNNNQFFKIFIDNGFSSVSWDHVPDEMLLYLFLHDEPTIGKKRSDNTKREYFRDVKEFIEFANHFGGTRYIDEEDVQKYQYIIEEKNLSPSTLRRKTSVIKQFLTYLFKRGALKKDVTIMLKRVSVDKEQLVNRDFYDHEVQQLLEYFKKENYFAYTLLYVLVSTGLRIDELATAEWSSLFYYPKNDSYFLSVTGKRNKERNAKIFNDVLEVVSEFRKRRGINSELSEVDETAFFPKASGEHYNSSYLSTEFSRLILTTSDIFPFIKRRKMLHEKGDKRFNITPHTCRHYTAAYFADKGIDLKSIQDMLGHESLLTTERYLRRRRNLEDHAGVKVGGNFIN
ncbi:tyrosine-type recombinase/integrase [Metabacillus endolithicus]|uniref:Tyrosine-type recombinase/integrase n=1 Tax=Metabacillus endolithicus TaxID=1535204 RepID=A0ABW5C5F3_9BACI|nr:tyrosine-type recombinase/integrase [Metabacillus endolithicus]UPG66258.1 tyrosine-type recombinase/integrase [Metabacillus endolithicus]